jgi:hypothetical protein
MPISGIGINLITKAALPTTQVLCWVMLLTKFTMDFLPESMRLFSIFMPYAMERVMAAHSSHMRFVHYTSADAALNILRSKQVWMRKSSCMNDFMEVEHGLDCIYAAYLKSDGGARFKEALDKMFGGLRPEIEMLFDGWAPFFRTDTYFTCISEHDSAEDTFGRLSMWRAYGESTGIALVVNNAPFLAISDALAAYTSPVAYLNNDEIGTQFALIADKMNSEADFLRSVERETIKAHIFSMLRYAAICTKHPGFREEREWRVVYSPSVEKSKYLEKEVRTIRGVPQPIYKIPLKNVPGLSGIDIPSFVDRIVIGPSQYPSALREAFIDLLVDAGVKDAANRVFASDIPLRR